MPRPKPTRSATPLVAVCTFLTVPVELGPHPMCCKRSKWRTRHTQSEPIKWLRHSWAGTKNPRSTSAAALGAPGTKPAERGAREFIVHVGGWCWLGATIMLWRNGVGRERRLLMILCFRLGFAGLWVRRACICWRVRGGSWITLSRALSNELQ